MECSFQHYLQRPENRALAEAHQRKECLQAMKRQEKANALDFRAKVLNADIESQKAVAPLLQNKVLRRVIQTFTNDENGDMQRWACNPEVLRLLYEAKKRMEDGTVSEDEMERLLLEQFQKQAQTDGGPGGGPKQETLGMEDLVGALNEHLTERRRGNERYHVKDFRAAKHSYERAKSILDLIKGAGPAEQEEINVNRVAMLLNLAALFLATKEHQAAVQACTEALELDGGSSKALLRRAKAATRMHDYQAARRDLETLQSKGLWSIECESCSNALQQAKEIGRRTDAKLFGSMLC